MRRLWPVPSEQITPAEQYGSPVRTRQAGRPWVGICMVSSIDGAVALAGRSGGLSSPTDHAVLLALRQTADLVLVGAGTASGEGYGPPRKPGLRIGVVTASGRVDPARPLFTSGAGFLVTTEEAPDHGLDAVRAGHGRVDLVAALGQLDATFVHVEGGPTLNAALVEADLVDEVNLTVSPAVVGGDGPRAVNGASEALRSMRLTHVCEGEGFLFLRYVRH